MQAWAILIFPLWVFLVSAYLLAASGRRADEAGGLERCPGACVGPGLARIQGVSGANPAVLRHSQAIYLDSQEPQ